MCTANLKNLIAACILSLLIICTASGDVIVVNPGESIQAAIDSAFYGDTVEVAAGTYIERITLKDGVAVIGAGAGVTIIDGDSGGSVVTSNGCDANTALEGFTITNGRAANGGGMYNVNSSPTIKNCTFSGNTTNDGSVGYPSQPGGNAGHGGGVYNNNSSPAVTNCTFQNNTTGAGGAGGVAMAGSTPGGAGGDGGDGAGIYNTNNSSAILLNCVFSGNAAGAGGDGADGGDGAGPGMFGGNGGSGGDGGRGGGVYNNNSTATLINCIFNSNSAGTGGNGGDGGDGYDDSVIDAKGGNGGDGGDGGDGGGAYNNNCSPVVTNCTFHDNSCGDGGLGGAGGTGAPAGDDGADGTGGIGGGIYNETSSPAVTNCILWADTPDEIYNSSSSPIVTYCDVEGGYTGTDNINEDPLFVNAAGGDFHLLFGSPCIDAGTNSAPSLPETDFEGDTRIINGIVDMGADEYIGSAATSPSPADGATMVSLDAQLSWTAGVWAVSHDVWFGTDNPPTTLIADDIADTNVAPGPLEYGVTYYWQVDENTSEGTVTGDVWSFRTEIWDIWVDDDYWDGGENDGHTWGIDAFDNIGAGIYMAEYGITVHVAAGTYLENITLKNGVALIGAGAGDAVIDGGASGSVVTSTGCDANTFLEGFTLTGGIGTTVGEYTYGGGMYNEGSSPTVANCKFIGNEASGGGGMDNRVGSRPTVTNCTFSGNSVNYGGGGMANRVGSSPTVTNCTFSGNTAGNDGGGGMFNYNNSSPTVTNCTFSGNSVNKGGGMANRVGSSPTVTNCTFSGNTAGNGGGMYNNEGSSPTVTNCNFIGNSADYYGGGMFNDSSSPTVTNCTFGGNTADLDGGGMCNYSYSSPMVTNCTFSGNSAEDNGGGMYNNGYSNPTVTNCTLAGNVAANGSALAADSYNQNYPSNVQLTNCVLRNDGNEIYNNDNSTIEITYSNIQGGWAGIGTGNIDADPCFIDAASGNLRLKSASPCIDAGDNNAANPAATDLDEHPRIIDGDCDENATVDMGAYEFNYAYMGDLDYNCSVDFFDFSIFSRAWMTKVGDPYWDWACDMSDPHDDYIDWRDVAILCGNWLAGTEP
jgi:parallel beta-helix repeat protein